MSSTLVTGGAGYIGSVTVEALLERGESVVVLDNLSIGHRGAVPESVPFYEGTTGDRDLVSQIVREHDVDACVHFAAYSSVAESVADPARYLANNAVQGMVLFETLIGHGVRHIVLSSTAAVYGEPESNPIAEDAPRRPVNPYGMSKVVLEQALEALDESGLATFAALRYFNAAGASELRGEDHRHESHIIPIVLAAAAGKRDGMVIYGDDYPTPDGTAVRDYIHVVDLANAHVAALTHLKRGGSSLHINLGTGTGYSVREVVAAVESVTGQSANARLGERRPGDPPVLVADPGKGGEVLGWTPKQSDLTSIVGSAWRWHTAHPLGYGD